MSGSGSDPRGTEDDRPPFFFVTETGNHPPWSFLAVHFELMAEQSGFILRNRIYVTYFCAMPDSNTHPRTPTNNIK